MSFWRGASRYYVKVLRRAWRDAWVLAHRQGVIVALALALVAALIAERTWADLGQPFNVAVAIYLAIASSAVIVTAFWLVNLLLAPYRMMLDRETQANADNERCLSELAALRTELESARSGLDERERRRATRSRLAMLLREGENLLNGINSQQVAPTQEVQDWIYKAAGLIRSELDDSFVSTFFSDSGLLPFNLSKPLSDQHQNLFGFLHNRCARLKEFIDRIPS
jgi:hypothetical protein